MNTEQFSNMQELSESDCETITGSGGRFIYLEDSLKPIEEPVPHRPHKPKGPKDDI